jgi:hypothetical protein
MATTRLVQELVNGSDGIMSNAAGRYPANEERVCTIAAGLGIIPTVLGIISMPLFRHGRCSCDQSHLPQYL